MSFEEFQTDRRTSYAVVRCLEIISEASQVAADRPQARHPDIPWTEIAGAGSVYRHRISRRSGRFGLENSSRKTWKLLRIVVEDELATTDQRMTAPLLHPDGLKRCPWPKDDPLYVAYHDEEWGVPEFDDRALYEKLILDGFQAGLSWITILRKRDNFRRAFDGFEPAEDRALSSGAKVEKLMQDAGIVRNRAKIEGTVAVGARLSRRDGEGAGLLGAALEFRRRQAQVEPLPQHQAGPGRNAAVAQMSKELARAASTSSGRPSSTPSCRRSAWSTTTWSTATATRPWRSDAPARPTGRLNPRTDDHFRACGYTRRLSYR